MYNAVSYLSMIEDDKEQENAENACSGSSAKIEIESYVIYCHKRHNECKAGELFRVPKSYLANKEHVRGGITTAN
jgi:hypothetical protein